MMVEHVMEIDMMERKRELIQSIFSNIVGILGITTEEFNRGLNVTHGVIEHYSYKGASFLTFDNRSVDLGDGKIRFRYYLPTNVRI